MLDDVQAGDMKRNMRLARTTLQAELYQLGEQREAICKAMADREAKLSGVSGALEVLDTALTAGKVENAEDGEAAAD